MFFLKVVETLERNAVPYIVTGGYAMALHGYIRKTFDVDLIVENNIEGLTELQYALRDCELYPLKFSAQSISKLIDVESSWIFSNPKDTTEVVDVQIKANLLDFKPFYKKVQTYDIPILSTQDLILMKQHSIEPKDQEDLKYLMDMDK